MTFRLTRQPHEAVAILVLQLAACGSEPAQAPASSADAPLAAVGVSSSVKAASETPPCGPEMARIPGAASDPAASGGGLCMDRTETTVADYRKCVDAGACAVPGNCNWAKSGREDHPINCVDWYQADAFCRWRGKRLPTEEEWARAAGGGKDRTYPWGNEPPDGRACQGKSTCPVGTYPAGDSPFGVKDLSGNVWEWTASGSKEHPVIRGGPFYGNAASQAVDMRVTDADPAHRSDEGSGFRCARASR